MKVIILFSLIFLFSCSKYNFPKQEDIKKVSLSQRCVDLINNRFSVSESEIKELESCILQKRTNLINYNIYTATENDFDKTRYITSSKFYHVIDHPGLLYFIKNQKKYPIGGIAFKLKDDPTEYITMEAPFSADVFSDIAWRYNIKTYVTLIDENRDNDPLKLQVYRNSSSNRVDLHHLKNMIGKDFSFDYKVLDLNFIQSQQNLPEVLLAKLQRYSEIRNIIQISEKSWEDNEITDIQNLLNLVHIIDKNHKDGVISFNCFAGLHRTKVVLLAYHMYLKNKRGIRISAENEMLDYDQIVDNEIVKKNGGAQGAESGRDGKQYKLLIDFADYLNKELEKKAIYP